MMQIIVVVIMAMAFIIGGTKLLRAADERERVGKGSNVVMSEYREGMEKPSSRVKSPEKEPTIQPLYGIEPGPVPVPDPGPRPLYGPEPVPRPESSFAVFLEAIGVNIENARLGDWNGDGKVTAKDIGTLYKVYQQVRKALREGTLKATDISLNKEPLRDLNGDGEINKRDVHIQFKVFSKAIREQMHKDRRDRPIPILPPPDDGRPNRPMTILPPQDGRPDRPMTIIAAPPQS